MTVIGSEGTGLPGIYVIGGNRYLIEGLGVCLNSFIVQLSSQAPILVAEQLSELAPNIKQAWNRYHQSNCVSQCVSILIHRYHRHTDVYACPRVLWDLKGNPFIIANIGRSFTSVTVMVTVIGIGALRTIRGGNLYLIGVLHFMVQFRLSS